MCFVTCFYQVLEQSSRIYVFLFFAIDDDDNPDIYWIEEGEDL